MKKIITILGFLFIFLFIGATLYVFKIPPFTSQTSPETIVKPQTETPKTQLPSNNQTFNEFIKNGDELTKNGFYDLAIKEYQSAQKLEPNNVTPLLKIANIHLRSNNLTKAEEILQSALKIFPNNLEAQLTLGRTYIAQRNIDQGRELFLSLNYENSATKYYQAMIKILDGDHEPARQLFQAAIDLKTDPEIPAKAQKFLDAYREFDTFQASTDSHLNTLLGRAFTEVEEYQMAIPLLFEVIKQKNDYRDAWILLGYSYLKTQQYPEATDALEEAKKIDSQKPETLFFLGLAYFNQDKLDQAVTNLELAKENGFQPVVQVEQKLAEIYTIQEKYDEAAANYENIISLNDSDITLFVQPIWIYINKTHQPEKASALANKALTSHPENAMSHNLAAWIEIETGNYTVAKSHLQVALELNPNFDAAHLNLGRIYENESDFVKAKEHFQKAFELGNGNSISQLASEKYATIAKKEQETIQANLFN